MRIQRKAEGIVEGDLTPMIDMTFQLIAFFMVLVNFSQADQYEKIQLPKSELAKPPENPIESPITLNLTRDGDVVISGQAPVSLDNIGTLLTREANLLAYEDKSPSDATIIIRADAKSKMKMVQQLMKVCQENRFDRFALRVKEDVGN